MKNSRVELGPPPAPAAATEVALSGQRMRVLAHVRAHGPIRIADAATQLGVHPNTVREHADALVGLGLIDRTTEAAAGRGRPAALYRPSHAGPAAGEYAALATALAGHLARTSANPEKDAREAGAEWGRELIDGAPHTDADVRPTILDSLARLGFDPHDDGTQRGIALRRCPLLDAAKRYPAVVCQVHLGIVEGMLRHLETPTAGTELVAFAEPGACRLFLPDGGRHD